MPPKQSALLDKIVTFEPALSDEQQKPVRSSATNIRIVAGAGAGKTETLTRYIIRLLLHDHVDPTAIVAFTFTEKAAENMKSRVYYRLLSIDSPEARAVGERLGDLYIGTIHAYCLRLLQQQHQYGIHGVLDQNQAMAFLFAHADSHGLNIKEAFHRQGMIRTSTLFALSLGAVYAEMLSDEVMQTRAPTFHKIQQAYEELLDDHRRFVFDQLITRTVIHLRDHPDVAAHIRHLIVDEYQDINQAQRELIDLLGHNALFVVGDPRQTIYEWRGSDVGCFTAFADQHAGCASFGMIENRRSTTSVMKVANALSDQFGSGVFDPLEPKRNEPGAAYLVSFETAADEAQWIAGQIARAVRQGEKSYADFAILLRSVKTSGEAFIAALRAADVPFQLGGKVGLFRRPEVRALAKLFCWIHPKGYYKQDPYNEDSRISGDKLLASALEDWAVALPGLIDITEAEVVLRAWRNEILALNKKREGKHFSGFFQTALTHLGYLSLDVHDPSYALMMANIGRFNTLLTDYETARRLGGNQESAKDRLAGLHYFINYYANEAYEEQVDESLPVADAVQIMTVHQAKGLEWPVVFVPCVVRQRFPSKRMGEKREWLIPRDDTLFPYQRYEGGLESERRLFYVAITRARDVLVVSQFDRVRTRASGTSVFLEEDGGLLSYLTPLSPADNLRLPSWERRPEADEIQTYGARSLIDYRWCPHMYRLNYVWNYQPGLAERLGYGTALHHCLHGAARELAREGGSVRSAVANAVEDGFFLPFANDSISNSMKNSAVAALNNFVGEHRDRLTQVRDMECRVEFRTEQAVVAGKVDVIARASDGVEVWEYKTSEEATTEAEAALQLRLYALGLAQVGEQVTGGSLALITDNEIRPVSVNPEALEEAARMASEAIRGIQAGQFDPTPSPRCTDCDFSTICRYQQEIS